MCKWIMCLGIVAMAGCSSPVLRCDGRLTAINPPVAEAGPAPGAARGGR
jgi:hypothetical protein